jgi:hypothetical protein
MPEWIIIPLSKTGKLGYFPDELERWREAIKDFVVSDFDKVTVKPGDVCFLRVQLIEIEQPTLIQELCTVPAYALKSYKLTGHKVMK